MKIGLNDTYSKFFANPSSAKGPNARFCSLYKYFQPSPCLVHDHFPPWGSLWSFTTNQYNFLSSKKVYPHECPWHSNLETTCVAEASELIQLHSVLQTMWIIALRCIIATERIKAGVKFTKIKNRIRKQWLNTEQVTAIIDVCYCIKKQSIQI